LYCAVVALACSNRAAALPCGGSQALRAGGEGSAPASALSEPRVLYHALNGLRVNVDRVFEVHSLHLQRDVVRLTLNEGRLAFLEPIAGRVTGAVFTGRGHAIATPHDPGERRSLAQFLGVPILDLSFSRAYIRFDDDTASEIEQDLRDANSETVTDPAFSESWDPAIAALNPWHSLRIMLDLLSTNAVPYFYAAMASDSAGPFDMLLDPRREEQVVIGQSRITGGAEYYDVWASFRTADAPAATIPSLAALDYRVETTIADDLSLEGKTTLHVRALRSGERVVPLELSRNLVVQKITGQDGQPLAYFQNEDMSRRDIALRGNDAVLVILSAPTHADEEFHLQVSYRGSVISAAGNGVEFVGERGAWYAHVPGDASFVSFDLSFRWPSRLTVVATGIKVESHDAADARTGRWRSDAPFSLAGFNLGEYKMEAAGTDHPRIELFANPELESAILERLARNAPTPPMVLPTPDGPVGVLPRLGLPSLPPSPSTVLKHLGGAILDSIRFYEKLNGPFPFSHLEISQIPGSFGQGWPELVYLSTLAFLPSEAQEQVGLTREEQEEALDLMPYHEVAHQWWGNVVTSATYRDVWIQEGMANYLALLYADSRKPGAHRARTWLERYRTALITKPPGSDETPDEAGPLNLGYRLTSSKTPEAYDIVTYDKGTWVMHMLHEMMSDPAAKDPDTRFRELLHSILTDFRFRPLSTADFQRAVERQMTPSMDIEGNHSLGWFFDEWVRDTGIPHYKVEFQAKPHGQDFLVAGKLEQADVGTLFTAPVPIYATHAGGKPTLLGVVITTGPESKFHFVTRFRPVHLLIDPYLTLLCRTD
jgi:hypothetical protein